MTASPKQKSCDLAIVGMACLFPASLDKMAFWRLILRNLDAITEVPDSHWAKKDYFAPSPGAPDMTYCTRGGYLSPYPFDPAAFGIPPNLLEVTDTSQLLGLVTARCALDDAGYPKDRDFDRSRTSVILGATGTQELVIPLASRLSHPIWKEALAAEGLPEETQNAILERMSAGHTAWQENAFPGLLGNVIAGRIANRLDLGGSNCVVDAACGSSLAALHMATMELQTGKADMVITGGVDTLNDIFMHMCFAQTGVLSHSGDARPFSEKADGTVLGEGIGMVVLKRLDDAEKNKDRIYAVIKGMGTASDGKNQSIYAPGAEGQIRALKKACAEANFDPKSVDLVEAHGTGTRVGDAVEFKALQAVYGTGRETQPCVLSSVKANIGHTKAAAGMAGFIKTVLCLYYKILPPALKHLPPDPNLEMENSGFRMLEAPIPWLTEPNRPRRAAVSAFGFGGADYHAVLEEYGNTGGESAWDFHLDLFCASGPDKAHLLSQLCLLENLDPREPRQLQEICDLSRKSFSETHTLRLLLLLEPGADIQDLLSQAKILLEEEKEGAHGKIFFGKGAKPGKLAFLFPGQGSQYPGMGRILACIFPEMLESLTLGDAALRKEGANHRRGNLLSRFLYPLEGEAKAREEALRSTDLAQPGIGCVSLGMAKILNRFGIHPDATCGHSYGEIPALTLSGVFSDQECMELSVLRGRYMAGDPEDPRDRGSMMAVRCDGETLRKLIENENLAVVLANENSPSQCVLSGGSAALDHAEKVLKTHKIRGIRLPVSAAFHSPLVEDAARPFEMALKNIALQSPKIPVMANVMGKFHLEDIEIIRKTMAFQLLSPVRFIENVRGLFGAGVRTFVEVGPKNVLTGLASAILESETVHCLAMDASSGKNGDGDLLILLCRLAALGYGVNWRGIPDPPANPKRKMSVWLSGANLKPKGRNKADVKKAVPSSSAFPVSNGLYASEENPFLSPRQKEIPQNKPPQKASEEGTHLSQARMPSQNTPLEGQALPSVPSFPSPKGVSMDKTVLVEGLQTLRSLQEQTTRAHEQFLSLQSEAGRTLERLLTTMGATQISSHSPVEILAIEPAPRIFAEEKTPSPAVRALPESPDPNAEKAILSLLLATVSKQTGYPEEMIQQDMDLEADLGIDSIKRVEILSELEGHFPILSSLAPEILTQARTLGAFLSLLAKPGETGPAPIFQQQQSQDLASSITPASAMVAITAVVSGQTGYPEEMVQPEMDLEADLGIDSIKRVEILSELEGHYPVLGNIPQETLQQCRSVRRIAALLGNPDLPVFPLEEKVLSKKEEAPRIASPEKQIEKTPAIILRSQMVWEEISLSEASLPPAPAILQDFGKNTLPLLQGLFPGKEVFLFSCKESPNTFYENLLIPWDADNQDKALASLFTFLAAWGKKALLSEKACSLCIVTRSDGHLGQKDPFSASLETQSLSGLMRTLEKEWPHISLRLSDLAPECMQAKALLKQCLFCAGPLILGCDLEGKIRTPLLKTLPRREETPTFLPPEKDDLMLVTGGAYGVTASCVEALARRYPCRLLFAGRSPAPKPEPLWLSGIRTEDAVRKALLRHHFDDKTPTPKELEAAFRTLQNSRAIRETLQKLKLLGCEADYISLDLEDPEAITTLMEKLKKEGRTPAYWVHGAGVLADKAMVDKRREDFDKVFGVKALSAKRMATALENTDLKGMVFFSSVASLQGNPGQADYALANGVLNALARRENMKRKTCHALSICWGPWEGGMVSPALARHFERQGISLIPLEKGSAAFCDEWISGVLPEILIGAGRPSQNDSKEAIETKTNIPLSGINRPQTRENPRIFSLNAHPEFEDHSLGGKAVVPFASLACEMLRQESLPEENMASSFRVLEDLRLLKGCVLEEGDTLPLDLKKKGDLLTLVSLEKNPPVPRMQCRSRLDAAPPSLPESLSETRPYPRNSETVYREILFHGKRYQVLETIVSMGKDGMTARLSTEALDNHPDPLSLILDSAMQLACLFGYESTGRLYLPTYVKSLRIPASFVNMKTPPPVQTLSYTMENCDSHTLFGNIHFLDAEDRPCMEILGLAMTATENMAENFKSGGMTLAPCALSA